MATVRIKLVRWTFSRMCSLGFVYHLHTSVISVPPPLKTTSHRSDSFSDILIIFPHFGVQLLIYLYDYFPKKNSLLASNRCAEEIMYFKYCCNKDLISHFSILETILHISLSLPSISLSECALSGSSIGFDQVPQRFRKG